MSWMSSQALRWGWSVPGSSPGYSDHDRTREPCRDTPGNRRCLGCDLRGSVVPEYAVIAGGHACEVAQARGVTGGAPVDGVADTARHGHLRGKHTAEKPGGIRRISEYLEMNVRIPAVVTAGKDRGESELPVGTGGLHATQIILVLQSTGVQRVISLARAVPYIDGPPGQRRATAVGIHYGNRQLQGHAGGDSARTIEAAAYIAADDAVQEQ